MGVVVCIGVNAVNSLRCMPHLHGNVFMYICNISM